MIKLGIVTGLVLVAGSGSRFGSNKIVARLPGGEIVGLQAARRIFEAVDNLIVVTRLGDDATAKVFRGCGMSVSECPDARDGMAHTLRHGVSQCETSDACVVAFGDMPFVTALTVTKLVCRFRETQGIVVPTCGGRDGHPVVFPSRFFADLAALSGDVGARTVVDAYRSDVERVETVDDGILRDIDRPEDLGGSS